MGYPYPSVYRPDSNPKGIDLRVNISNPARKHFSQHFFTGFVQARGSAFKYNPFTTDKYCKPALQGKRQTECELKIQA
jgi:hypothetical protein